MKRFTVAAALCFAGGIVFAWMDRYPGDLTAGEKPVDRGERRDAGGELCTGTVFLPE